MAVVELVEVFRLLVMREPNGIGPHFANERVVFVVVGLRECRAFARALLVAVHSVQRVGLAIEQKAFVLVDGHCAYPQRLRHFVEQCPSTAQANPCRVEIRIGDSLPKARSRDFHSGGVFARSGLGDAF